MYCSKCGNQLNDNGNCEFCEKPIAQNEETSQPQSEGSDKGGCIGAGSIISAIIAGIGYLALVIGATVMTIQDPNVTENEPAMAALGLGIFFFGAINIFAIILSAIFICISKKRLLLAIGIAMHVAELIAIVLLITVGLVAG